MEEEDFLESFYSKVEESEDVNEEFMNSFKKLIANEELEKDSLIDLIDGVFDD